MGDRVEELMTANLMDVFNEREPQRRRAAIEQTYSADVRWTDDEGVSVGWDQLEAKAKALQEDQLAGLSFTKAGPVYQTQGFGYLAWNILAPGNEAPIVSGFDVALISDDRISQLFTVLTKTPG
ncbi:nuclear transport factor 2 family protein [Mycolicibacterium mengxianglii]|uniref:nuclear transport factor 2 family protein n=1 Tax=Mycolicibacterium mengxianglii TaxID=2736649 RepID=UPI0018D074F6|nr:nuclear transport factor 2 family protein [Mycolicibacterium mengxianglii]